MAKLSQEEFIIYKDKYISSHKKIIITCPIHGDFEQTPYTHIQGTGCPIKEKINKVLHDKE